MKKLSVLILALAMIICVFAACDKVEEKTSLDYARDYVYTMYKEDDGSATMEDFKLVGIVNIDGVVYDVTWTTDAETVLVNRSEDGKTVTIDVDEKSPAEVNYTLTATIKDEEGKTVSCSFKHTVPQYVEYTVGQVLEFDVGTAVVMNGTVTAIDTEWSEQYGNISVYVEDAEGNKILCYRLGTKVEVGDVITVKGSVGAYNGAKQIAQGATAEITDHVEIVVEYPEMTLAEAIACDDGTQVCITGVVVNIAEKDAWSDKYGNISVTITDGKNTLYIYRMKTKVELGDLITIKGNVGSYNDAKQIAAGSTAEIVGTYTAVTIPEAVAAEDGTLVIVTGTVKEIPENGTWSDKYNNMSVTIEDAEGNTLYLYRLGTKVELGDLITVYGKVGSYNGAKQIAAGAFAEIAEVPAE